MFETKATLMTMGKLFAKRIATFVCDMILASLVCLLGTKPKFKFNFATKKKKIQQPLYTNPLFALIYFANQTLSRISINTIATSISILGI